MMFTAKQREEFYALTTPLIAWMGVNFHPHSKVIVDDKGAEMFVALISNVPPADDHENG